MHFRGGGFSRETGLLKKIHNWPAVRGTQRQRIVIGGERASTQATRIKEISKLVSESDTKARRGVLPENEALHLL